MEPTADPIELGSMLFTLVEPRPGHEVAYHRWYERDHFYAGCLIGPFLFAGRRWVATRALKDLRYPTPSPVAEPVDAGSYLATYWILRGHHDDHVRWAVDQVHTLHASGRMFAERDHVHTLLYEYRGTWSRDEDPVPPELALDHPFPGLVAVIGRRARGVEPAALEAWYSEQWMPERASGSPVALRLAFSAFPLPDDAPADVPRTPESDQRFLHLCFLDADPRSCWDDVFAGEGKALEASGLGEVLFAAPFIPTVPGTDRYTDELW